MKLTRWFLDHSFRSFTCKFVVEKYLSLFEYLCKMITKIYFERFRCLLTVVSLFV